METISQKSPDFDTYNICAWIFLNIRLNDVGWLF